MHFVWLERMLRKGYRPFLGVFFAISSLKPAYCLGLTLLSKKVPVWAPTLLNYSEDKMEARKRERDDEKDIHGLFAMNKKKKSNTDSEAILQYIDEHGFGETTPPLTKSLKADVFKQHYYDKNELMEF